MSIRNIALSSLLALAAFSSQATIEGTFWDPTFDGEGWTIESQNDVAFWTWYTYTESGDPTFRTAVCNVTYRVEGGSILTDCEGALFETRNRTETTELGTFTANFSTGPDGFQVGQVDAAGTQRTIVPFQFNYQDEIDFIHGAWVVNSLNIIGPIDGVLVVFESVLSELEDGRPAREFVTTEGLPGYAYFEEAINRFVAVVDFQDGTALVANFMATDDKAVGTTQVTDNEFRPLAVERFGLASSIANTEGELDALESLLGVSAAKKNTEIRLRPVPVHLFID